MVKQGRRDVEVKAGGWGFVIKNRKRENNIKAVE
jgi:hypothetical protein